MKQAQQPPLFGPCLLWPRSHISATAELLLLIRMYEVQPFSQKIDFGVPRLRWAFAGGGGRLKNRKIAISPQRLDWAPRNLARWRRLALSTVQTVKNSKTGVTVYDYGWQGLAGYRWALPRISSFSMNLSVSVITVKLLILTSASTHLGNVHRPTHGTFPGDRLISWRKMSCCSWKVLRQFLCVNVT